MGRVALFSTCMADFAAPGPAQAARDFLEALGHEVVVPADQSCCGQPALNSGYPREAARLMDAWVDTFSGFEHVVSVAGSCTAMLAHHGGELVSADRRMPRLWEFSQFVVAQATTRDLGLHLNARVTYHDACHMTRMLGERHTPRALLSLIDGLELVEMTDSDSCCGFGGTFCVKYPGISDKMVEKKAKHIAATGADTLIAGDLGCLMNMAGKLKREGSPIKARHIAEVLAGDWATPAIAEAE